jgi:hypothetical protein
LRSLVINFKVNKILSSFQVHRCLEKGPFSIQKNIPSPFRMLGLCLNGRSHFQTLFFMQNRTKNQI